MNDKIGKWIYDGDCMITTCCNHAIDIGYFKETDDYIFAPNKCPYCGAEMIKIVID